MDEEIKLIQRINKCVKKKCKESFEKVSNDKKLILAKKRLDNIKDLKKKEKAITDIYLNKNQKELSLCTYKKCKNKKIIEFNIKLFKDKIKLYNIILSPIYKKKFDKLIELTNKTNLTDDEYIKYIILFNNIKKFINNKEYESKELYNKAFSKYLKCKDNKCNELSKKILLDSDLFQKKMLTYSIKNNKKRNEVIKDYYSNENQVNLDKCLINNCNRQSLKYFQEFIKSLNNKIKAFDLKLPINLQLPEDIKKINENNWTLETDIPNIWFDKKIKTFMYYGRDMEALFTYTKISHGRRIYGKTIDYRKKLSIDDLDKGYEIFMKNKKIKETVVMNMYI